jgi:membrane-bound lytic murein transglycosylase
MGLGVKGLCLLPYYTLATDQVAYPAGTMLYMPRARGVLLPDGSIHQGFFLVRDTGGAFHGIGKKRVDMFVGLEVDGNNAFSRVGFHHRKEEQSFIVNGESKQRAIEFLKTTFGPLYND